MPVLLKANGHQLATQVEWMKTPAERTLGLLKYQSAPKDYAAIFKLPFGGFFPLIHTIGMKFPIDILFCSPEKKVIYRKLNLGSGKFAMPLKNIFGGAQYLLEFSGCNLNEIKIGDYLEWTGESNS